MGIVQRDSFRLTIISYSGAALGYLNKLFLFTNFLTTPQVGLANLLVTLSVIYAQVAALGAYNIMLRFFPFFNDRRQGHHGFLFGLCALVSAGFVITTLLFLALQAPFRAIYQASSPLLAEHALYIIPLAMASLFYQVFEAYLRSLYRNILPSLAHEIILRLLITLCVALFAMGVIPFPMFVALYVGVHCVPAILLIVYTALIRQLALRPAWTPRLRRLGRIILVFGLFSLLNNLGTFLLVSIDSLMVAGMLDLGAAGIYTTMIFIASVMLIPYRSMIKVSAPLVASFWKARDMGKMQELYSKATAGNLVVGSVLFILLWVNLDSIFSLMPGEYAAGRYVFLLLGLGKLFDMGAGLNGTILLTSKKYRYDLYFTLGLLLFAVLGNWWLIPLLGMEGAALASMATLILFNLLRILFIQRQFGLQPFARKHAVLLVLLPLITWLSGRFETHGVLYLDVPLRSLAAALLFFLPAYAMKLSPEINLLLDRWLSRLR